MTTFIARRFADMSRRAIMRAKFQAYKATLKCAECGEDHSYCLEFHHLDPSEKEITVTKAIQQRWSWDRIMREVDKCVVLCANCHRKLHNPMVPDYATISLDMDSGRQEAGPRNRSVDCEVRDDRLPAAV